MKKIIKIAVLTVFAITLLASCESKIPDAPEEVVGMFTEAYNVAAQIDNATAPYDLKKTVASYDFEFKYDTFHDNEHPESNTETSSFAAGNGNKYTASINMLYSALGWQPISQATHGTDGITFTIKDGTFKHSESSEGKSTFSPFDNTKTESKIYELSFHLTGFGGAAMEKTDEIDVGGVKYTISSLFEEIFGNETNGYKTVVVKFKGIKSGEYSCFIEDIDLKNTPDSFSVMAKQIIDSIWRFLENEGENTKQFNYVVKKLMDKEYKGLSEYSYDCVCEKALDYSDNTHFTKIENSMFSLKSKVTEEGTQLLDVPEAYIEPKIGLEYLMEWKMNADIKIEAKLNDVDYVFTYSTDDGILSVNGKYYYWK